MWQRFTERARRVILLAQEEATKLDSDHVGTEHLLLGLVREEPVDQLPQSLDAHGLPLGLVREETGVAAEILKQFGIVAGPIYDQVKAAASPGDGASDEPKLTPKAKRVLELAADEARRMRHNYIGTGHLLLGLLREQDGLAATILSGLGLDLNLMREQVASLDSAGEQGNEAATQAGARFNVTPATQRVLHLAASVARRMGSASISLGHWLKRMAKSRRKK